MICDYLTDYFNDLELKNIITSVIGTADAAHIENLVQQAIHSQLSDEIENILFLQPSAGVVFGLQLISGKKVVLKLYNSSITNDYLTRMNEIQATFNAEKFPAPKILSPIFKFNNTYAGFYELIEGSKANGHEPIIRDELAKYLARFSDIVDKHEFMPIFTFMQESTKGKLWPKPHNVLFDLDKTSKGAGWITKKARQARKIITSANLPIRLAHTDWDVKNTLFNGTELIAVFDWDSLGALSEPEMVGRACAQFTADWESDNKVTPTPDEGREFVSSYEKYRRCKFTPDEYKAVSASADYQIALISRFEHAGGSQTRHPYQDLLKECGEKSFLFV